MSTYKPKNKNVVSRNGIPHKDHLVNEFPSLAAMLRHYGISDVVYHYRLDKKKMTLEQTLTTPVMDSDDAGKMPCRDHLGNEFGSKKEMCDYWRIPRYIYFRRIRAGWSEEKALTHPVKASVPKRMILDHEGHKFNTVDEMCAFWDITKEQYLINIRNNLDKKRALTEVTKRPKYPKDHLGNEYRSINEMCRAYNTNKTTLRSRLELGWTLAEILENPENHSQHMVIRDMHDMDFNSKREMLEHFGVSYTTYSHRVNVLGMSPEDAVAKKNIHVVPCEDHLGNKFACQNDMMAWWHNSNGTYSHRLEIGLTKEQALSKIFIGTLLWKTMHVVAEYDDCYLLIYDGMKQIMKSAEIHALLRHYQIISRLESNSEIRDGWTWHKSVGKWHHVVHDDGRNLMLTDDEMFRLLFFLYPDVDLDT